MSEIRCRTILYGNSLILEGVRAELSDNPGMEVVMFDQPMKDLLAELRLLNPAAIIFDIQATQPDFLLPLLKQTGLQLIGIDPETHQALVWIGRQVRAVGAADLIGIIQETEPIFIRSKGE